MIPAMSPSSAADTIPGAKSLKPSKVADVGRLIEAAFSWIQRFRRKIAFPSDAATISNSIPSVLGVDCDPEMHMEGATSGLLASWLTLEA